MRGKMRGKTRIALSAALILGAVFPASAATKHHRPPMVLPMIVGRSLTWRSLAAILAAARRPVAHPAAMPARLHQIAGDELLRTTTRSSGESTKFSALVFFIPFRPVCSSPLPLFVAIAQDSIGEQPGRACSNHLA